jgi:hypothetical protein
VRRWSSASPRSGRATTFLTSDAVAPLPVPDAVAPAIGYRLWEVRGEALRSLWFPAIPWEPNRVVRARCLQTQGELASRLAGRDLPFHAAPDPRCGCGVWAASSPDQLPAAWSGTREIVVCGVVAVWGRVVVAERGWRGQFARPVALGYEAPGGLARWRSPTPTGAFVISGVARRYGVPVDARILDAEAQR